jgi:tetratricopeptide (TPR) repeat protein
MPIDFAVLWNFGDPAASQQRLAELVSVTTDPLERAEVLTQLARAQGLQRRFDQARRTLAEAEALIGGAPCRARVRLLLETGRVENSGGRPAAAAPWFERAWMLASELGDDALAIDAAHMLGIVLPGDDAAAWNRRALERAERSADPAARRWTASLRNNIGWWLHERGRFDEALAMFEQALDDRRAEGARGPLLIARWAVARCLRSLGRIDEALSEQQQLLIEHRRDGSNDGYVHEELAECLLVLGRSDEARPHFRRALELLAPAGQSDHVAPERSARWKRHAT